MKEKARFELNMGAKILKVGDILWTCATGTAYKSFDDIVFYKHVVIDVEDCEGVNWVYYTLKSVTSGIELEQNNSQILNFYSRSKKEALESAIHYLEAEKAQIDALIVKARKMLLEVIK